MPFSSTEVKEITVLGAGVIGLTTALKIQEHGDYRVTIIAEHFPTDPKSIKYASLWAGAHHVSVAGGDHFQRKIDIETFNTMWELSENGGAAEGCFLRLPQTEFYRDKRDRHETLELMPNFSELPGNSLIQNALSGIKYDSVNTDAPRFLNYILSRFLAAGGSIVRGSVQHINQVIEGGPEAFSSHTGKKSSPPDGIVVCLGLGARFMGGIEDQNLYPVRGQTVLLRAPWVKFGMSMSGGPAKEWTYVIPRRSGDVIVGGTYDANDWHPCPRPETTREILGRVLEMCPDIAPPESRAVRKPTIEDIIPIIVEEGCGFRPCRKGGVRLEAEWMQARQRRIPIIHNYGHGGFGYIASFGSASVAFKLLEKSLAGEVS
ncbi:D-amino-acid oxidase [Crassisporium funariophilum]|nr:D-amino-acid oxidase [Crassisporium funariophilum]